VEFRPDVVKLGRGRFRRVDEEMQKSQAMGDG
jgi:hypothetical protein